jgi:hypothetical protein
MLRRQALPLALVLASGCGTSTAIEPQLTVTQGLYGQLTQRCDQQGCVGAPREGTPVAWFDRSPFATDGGVKPTPIRESVSGKNGFYEFAIESNQRGYLAIGELRTTTGVQWFTATAATIPRGLARIDWRAGPTNEGTWSDVR